MMKLELQEELFRRYPKFFRKPGKRLISGALAEHVPSTCAEGRYVELANDRTTNGGFREYLVDDTMPFDQWGVECGDGWFSIIDRLSQASEHEIDLLISERVPKECWPRVAQIKEKFGTLRFRVRGPISSALRARIFAAEENASRQACERCGHARAPQFDSGTSSFCDACRIACEALESEEEFSYDEFDRHRAALRALLNDRPD